MGLQCRYVVVGVLVPCSLVLVPDVAGSNRVWCEMDMCPCVLVDCNYVLLMSLDFLLLLLLLLYNVFFPVFSCLYPACNLVGSCRTHNVGKTHDARTQCEFQSMCLLC